MRPDQHRPRTLTEAEPIPTGVVGQLAASAIDRYEQLTRNGRSAGDALWPPVEDPAAAARAARTAAAELETTAATRDWTVPAARVQQLAADAIGLYVEGVVYDYDRDQARAAAVAARPAGAGTDDQAADLPLGPAAPDAEHLPRLDGVRQARRLDRAEAAHGQRVGLGLGRLGEERVVVGASHALAHRTVKRVGGAHTAPPPVCAARLARLAAMAARESRMK